MCATLRPMPPTMAGGSTRHKPRTQQGKRCRRDWCVIGAFLLYATQMQLVDLLLHKSIDKPQHEQMNRWVTRIGGLLLTCQPLLLLASIHVVYRTRITIWLIGVACVDAITAMIIIVRTWGSCTRSRCKGNRCFPDWHWYSAGLLAGGGLTHVILLTACGMFLHTVHARVTYLLFCVGMWLVSFAKYRHFNLGRFWCYLVPLTSPLAAALSVYAHNSKA